VLKMSNIFYWNAQPTSIYVRDTHVSLATPCLVAQPRVSICDCLTVISRTSLRTLSTRWLCSETTACHCHLAAI
jgi:hypothetical protein